MQEYAFSIFGPGVKAGIWNGEGEPPFAVQRMNQVHGTALVEVSAYGAEPEADALWTRTRGVRLAVKTADCIPLVFADEEAGVIAAVHAGWRGLTADIIPKTLAMLELDASRLKVGVGPSLGTECAEFTDPLAEIPAKFHWAVKGKRVDLNGIARRQLVEAGVRAENIEWLQICTKCETTWPSWRRTQAAGRFLTWIELLGR